MNIAYKIYDNFRTENKVTRKQIIKKKIAGILELTIKQWYNAN